MIVRNITRSLPIVALVALFQPAFGSVGPGDNLEIEREGVQLIRQLEEVGRDVRYNAGRLQSFSRSLQISKWTHLHHLNQIKSLVNEGLQPALTRLVEIQPQLPDWKQKSIDKMLESAKALAADSNSAILAKNEAGVTPPAMNAEYRGMVSRIQEHSEALVKTADAAGTYAAARLKEHEAGLKALEAGLKVPGI